MLTALIILCSVSLFCNLLGAAFLILAALFTVKDELNIVLKKATKSQLLKEIENRERLNS
jgi:hypothetical protein